MNQDAGPIVIEQTYKAPVNVVWRAITDPAQMSKWFFEPITEFRPEPGFETEFIVHHEGVDYPHQWRVTRVEPGQNVTYGWRYGGYPGDSEVTWELEQVPEGTKLTFTHRGHESFAQDSEIFNSETCRAGWEYFLNDSLPRFLERQPAPPGL